MAHRKINNRKSKRDRIVARDGQNCHLCGRYVELDDITLDHVIPRVWGGTQGIDNLRVAHKWCNEWRSDAPLDFAKMRMLLLRRFVTAHTHDSEGAPPRATKFWQDLERQRQIKNTLRGLESERRMQSHYETVDVKVQEVFNDTAYCQVQLPSRHTTTVSVNIRTVYCDALSAMQHTFRYDVATCPESKKIWDALRAKKLNSSEQVLFRAFSPADAIRRAIAELDAKLTAVNAAMDELFPHRAGEE
jgi:phytoene dehydrogenase-like protein